MGFNHAISNVWAKRLVLTQTSVLKSEVNEAFRGVLTLLPHSTASYWNPSPALGRFWILSTLRSLQNSSPLSHLKTVCVRHKIRQ